MSTSVTKKPLRLPKPKKGKGMSKLGKAFAIGVPLAWTALGVAGNLLGGSAISPKTKKILKYSAITASVIATGVLAYLYGPAALSYAGTKLKAMGSYLLHLPYMLRSSSTKTEVPILASEPSSNASEFSQMLDGFEAEHGPLMPMTTLSDSNMSLLLDTTTTTTPPIYTSSPQLLNTSPRANIPMFSGRSRGGPSTFRRGSPQFLDDLDDFVSSTPKKGKGMGSRARHLNQVGSGAVWDKIKSVAKTGAKVAGATALTVAAIAALKGSHDFYSDTYYPDGGFSNFDTYIARNFYDQV